MQIKKDLNYNKIEMFNSIQFNSRATTLMDHSDIWFDSADSFCKCLLKANFGKQDKNKYQFLI